MLLREPNGFCYARQTMLHVTLGALSMEINRSLNNVVWTLHQMVSLSSSIQLSLALTANK